MGDTNPNPQEEEEQASAPATEQQKFLRSIPLPATESDFDDLRKLLRPQSLNDKVEPVYKKLLYADPKFRRLREAAVDAEAKEGKTNADDHVSALILRNHVEKIGGDPDIIDANVVALAHAMLICDRRYGTSRKERAITLGGQSYPGPEDAEEE
jgi:hypothetical protein